MRKGFISGSAASRKKSVIPGSVLPDRFLWAVVILILFAAVFGVIVLFSSLSELGDSDVVTGRAVSSANTLTALITSPSFDGSSHASGSILSFSGQVSYSGSSQVTVSWYIDRMGDGLEKALIKQTLQFAGGTSGSIMLSGSVANIAGSVISLDSPDTIYNLVLSVSDGVNTVESVRTFMITSASFTCSDGVQNQGETDVDCGGPCPSCPGAYAATSAAGFIRIDPSYPHSFKYDNGSRYFPFGDTAYYLMGEDMGTIEDFIDSRAAKKINFIRIFAVGGYGGTSNYYWPFGGTPNNPVWQVDAQKITKLDDVFTYAESKNVNIELLMWGYGRDGANGMWGNVALENMWVDYLVNRYKNRKNLFMWTVTNEFERYPSPNDDYTFTWSDVDGMNRIVDRIKSIDNIHPVGVHAGAAIGADERGPLVVNHLWDYSNVDVYNVFLRSGHWNTAPWGTTCPSGNKGVVYLDTYNNGELFNPTWDYGWSIMPLDIEDGVAADWNHAPARPYINTEFGYQFEDYLDNTNGNYYTCQVFSPGTVRRTAWLTAASGGSLAAGFAHSAVDFDTNKYVYWSPDQLVFLYDFFTKKTEYWKMSPHHEFVAQMNALLALPGAEYVAYFPRGGSNYVYLQPGTYSVEKLDTKNMISYVVPDFTATSAQNYYFDPPSGAADWALHLIVKNPVTSNPPSAAITTPIADGVPVNVNSTIGFVGTVSDPDSSSLNVYWYVDRMGDGLEKALVKQDVQASGQTSGSLTMIGSRTNIDGQTISLEEVGATYNLVLQASDGTNTASVIRSFTLTANKVCTDGASRSCDTGFSGYCSSGLQFCTSNVWGSCIPPHLSDSEVCGDGLDNNCDGVENEGCEGVCDTDGDGFDEFIWCLGGGPNTDCDDDNPSIYPGALEVCGDGVDQDCSGSDLSCPPASSRAIISLDLDDDVQDGSGNGYHAVNYGAVFVSGKRNGAALFGGSGQYLSIPFVGSLSSGSVAFWVRTNSNVADSFAVFFEGDGSDSYSSPGFEGDADEVRFYVGNGCELYSSLVADAWTHLVGTWDGFENRLFVNGVLVDSGSCSNQEIGISRFSVGGRDSQYSFNGAIDELNVYNYALDGGTVLNLFNSYSTPTCSDGIQNQGETGVDCGGPCPACVVSCNYYASPNGTGNGLSINSPFKIANFWSVPNIAGKTLCLLDGTYTGADSMIHPPRGLSGTPGNHITVKALNDGEVFIDGQGQRGPVYLYDNSWFVLQGFNAFNAQAEGCCESSVVHMIGSSNNIVRRVVAWNAANGNTDIFGATHWSHNVLFEDCAGFGTARKIFARFSGDEEGVSHTTNVTLRRVFARLNQNINTDFGGHQAISIAYKGDDDITENAIATIDGDFSGYFVDAGFGSSRVVEKRNKLLGSIVYRIEGQNVSGVENAARIRTVGLNTYVRDVLSYVGGSESTFGQLDYNADLNAGEYSTYSPPNNYPRSDIKYLTLIGGPGSQFSYTSGSNISHIIATDAKWQNGKTLGYAIFTPGANWEQSPNYVMAYNNNPGKDWNLAPAYYSTENPNLIGRCGNLLQYGCSDSQRPKVAGQSVGAQIQCRYENGVLTTKPLWPWPMDERIRIATCMYDNGFTKEQCKANPNLGVNVTKTVFTLGGGTVPNFNAVNPQVCPGGNYVTATCSDGIQNQGETGIDCGGPCPACLICSPGQTKSCTTGLLGICSAGTQACSNNNWGTCIQNQTPKTEICDGLDNNCDGQVDEGCSTVSTTYYFSTSGSDNNNGLSASSPKRTLAALQTLLNNAQPGDTFLLKRGDTWTERAGTYGLDIWAHGTAQNPIVIDAYGTGEKPKFYFAGTGSTGPPGQNDYFIRFYSGDYYAYYVTLKNLQMISNPQNRVLFGIWINGAGTATLSPHHITIDGIVIDGAKMGVGILFEARDITIKNSIIKNTQGDGPNSGSEAIFSISRGLKVINNTFINNVNHDDYGHSHSLYIYDEDVVIEGNTLRDGFNGMALVNLKNSFVRNNKISNFSWSGIHFSSRLVPQRPLIPNYMDNVIVEGNEIFNTQRGMEFLRSTISEGDTGSTYTRNIFFRNNLIHGILQGPYSAGIHFENSLHQYGTLYFDNVQIFHNVIATNPSVTYSSPSGIELSYTGINYNNIQIKNNILYNGPNARGSLLEIASASTLSSIILDNNIYYAVSGSDTSVEGITRTLSQFKSAYSSKEQYSISANPLFVNALGNNFRLSSGSPAIDAGANVGIYSDFDGNTRPIGSGYDIGAFEYGSVPLVCTSGQSKSCTTGLLGICSAGTQTCSNNNWGTCIQNQTPRTDVCGNGVDEDCNGADLVCVNTTVVLRTFYVSTSGDDTKDGRSEGNAWKSISKVNSFAFLPGDQILFKRGDVWTGQQLTINRSGTQTNRIFFGAYGTNPKKPVITMKYLIPNSNNPGSWSLHSSNIYKLNFPQAIDWSQMPHRVFRGNGEFYENELLLQKSLTQYADGSDPYAGDYLNNNGEFVIDDDALYVYSTTGKPATDMYFAFNPFINAIIQQAVVVDDADYLTIQNIDFQGGLTTMKVTYSDNIIIENCNIGAGGDTFGAFVMYSNNGVFRNNNVDNKNHNMYDYPGDGYGDGRFSGFDGLTLRGGTNNWLIEKNYFADWYHTALAIESHYQPEKDLVTTSNNNIIRDNYFTGEHIMYTRGLGLVCVGRNSDVNDPLCVDRAANNHVYRNVFHDLPTRTQVGGNNNYYYYNVFDTASNRPYGVIRASQFMSDHGLSENVYIFNNLFYESDDEAFWLMTSSNLVLQNNLFINVGKKVRTLYPPDWIVSMDIDTFGNNNVYKNNYFWIDKSAYPSKSDQYFRYGEGTLTFPAFYMNITEWNAANDVYGDTIIGNKLLGGSKSSVINPDLTLPAGSPAINAGVDISALIPVGFKDINGNLVNRQNPSVGAFEYSSTPLVCTSGQSKSCTTGLLGICSAGTQTCSNNNWGTCIQNQTPRTDVCGNGVDEDCNGADLVCVNTTVVLRTFYVSNLGDDAKDGKSEANAWKTLNKINTLASSNYFKPGDQILLKRGNVWNEQLNIQNINGNKTHYITFGAYGSGNKPIITSMQRVPGSNNPARWTRLDDNVYEMTFNLGELPAVGETTRIYRLWINGKEYCRAWDKDNIGVDNTPYSKPFWEVVQPGEWNNWPDSEFIWQFPRDNAYTWSTPKLRIYSKSGNNPASEYPLMEYSMNPRHPATFYVSSYFIIDNLDIRGGFDGVLWIEGSHDVIVQNSNIGKDTTRSGLRFVSGQWEYNYAPGYNLELKNNVFDKGDYPYCPTRPDTSSEGLDITWNVYNVSIHDNVIKGWSSAAFRVLGVAFYASKGPKDIYFYNNFIDGSSVRYARPFNIAGDSTGSIDTTPENIYIYNNYITNVSTRSQIAARNLNIHHNIWKTVGSRPMGLNVMHHDDDQAINFYTNETDYSVGSWGRVDTLSQAITISGVGSEINPTVRVFNNLFYDLNGLAFWQDSSIPNTIFANNLIINAAKQVSAWDGNEYRLPIHTTNIDWLNRKFLSNYIWVDKTKYNSSQDKYIGYGNEYPYYLMTVEQWNAVDGTVGDEIKGNRLLNGTMASVINPGLTLPSTSPARNAGVDISAWVPAGFRDMNGVLVDLYNPDIGAFEYGAIQCTSGQSQSCATNISDGYCSAGSQVCVNGQWGSCIPPHQSDPEICGNGIDDNCNGVQNEGCEGVCDTDNDGFDEFIWCLGGGPNTDCDDNNPLINPLAAEICGNSVDENCDGIILWECPPIDLNPLVELKMDNNVKDSSGNNNDGENYGAVFTTGFINQSASFLGSGQYVKIPFVNSLPLGTISFWLKTSSSYSGFEIFLEADGTQPQGYSSPGFEGEANSLAFYVNNACGLFVSMPSDEWLHVVGTWDGVQDKLYINGNLATSGTCPYGEYDITRFLLGGREQDYSAVALIDEVRIYNMAMSNDTVKGLYLNYLSQQSCVIDQIRSCNTTMPGICSIGSQTCLNGQWGSCVPPHLSDPEVCGNGVDDDCDGVVDDGCSVPVVNIVTPSQSITLGRSLIVVVNASDPQGIKRVDLFVNNLLYSSVSGNFSSYSFNWTPSVVGSYVLRAVAFDNQNLNSSVNITVVVVKPNSPPNVSIVSPANGQIFPPGSNVNITAAVSDIDGNLDRVLFYLDNSLKLTRTVAPFEYIYSNAILGTHFIKVSAYDRLNASANASISIQVNECTSGQNRNCTVAGELGLCALGSQTCANGQWGTCIGPSPQPEICGNGKDEDCNGADAECANVPPQIKITYPSNNSRFLLGNSIRVAANASDSDGNITKVEFFVENVLKLTDFQSPFYFDWNLTSKGTFVLKARATDNRNSSATDQLLVVVNECAEGTVKSCTTGLPGVCNAGNRSCVSGSWSGQCIGIPPGSNTEICGNSIDEDCDGSLDNGCSLSCDFDGDGFSAGHPWCLLSVDCNDYNASIYPGAPEVCGDGVDQDCDGVDLVCVDSPVIRPNSGEYKEKISVEMQAKPGEIIRFTIDGSEPDERSSEYSGPILLQPGKDDRTYDGMISTAKPFAVALWFNPRVAQENTNNGLLALVGDNVEWSFQLRYGLRDGYLGFIVNTFDARSAGMVRDVVELSLGKSVSAGSWHHVVVMYDLRMIYLYMDGELVDSLEVRSILPNNNLLVGDGGWNTLFDGMIDNVTIYNNALSNSEVKFLYDSALFDHVSSMTFKARAFRSSQYSNTATRHYTFNQSYDYNVPICSISMLEGSNPLYQYAVANRVYYNPSVVGSYFAKASVVSPLGVSRVEFPYASSPGIVLKDPPFQHEYQWTGRLPLVSSFSVSVTNNLGIGGVCKFEVYDDAAAPVGSSLSYGAGGGSATSNGSVNLFQNLVLYAGTDAGSGIDYSSALLERGICPDSSCSQISGWGTIYAGAINSSYTTISDKGLMRNTCYIYRFSISDNVKNTAVKLASRSLCVVGNRTPLIIISNNMITFNYANVTYFNYTNASFTGEHGRIRYPVIKLSRDLNITDNIRTGKALWYINSTDLPELNDEAEITFYGINYYSPIPYRDGVPCISSLCYNRIFDESSGTFVMTVSGFSTYTLNGSYCGDDVCDSQESCKTCVKDCGVCKKGGGGGGGGGGYVRPNATVNTTSVIVYTVTNNTDRNIEIINDTVVPKRSKIPFWRYLLDGRDRIGAEPDDDGFDDGSGEDVRRKGLGVFTIVVSALVLILILIVLGTLLSRERPDEYQLYRDYLSKMRERGYSDDMIRVRLKSVGWNDQEVDNLFELDKIKKK